LRDPRIHRALRGRRRDQARRIGIAARTARAIAKTPRILERRPGANRAAREREFNPEASRRARTVRSRREASVPRRRSIARARVFVSTVTLASASSHRRRGPCRRWADRATFDGEQAKDLRNPRALAAKSRMSRATDPLRDSFSSSPSPQAPWIVTAQNSQILAKLRRDVPLDCGVEKTVRRRSPQGLSVALSFGRRFAAIDTRPLHGR